MKMITLNIPWIENISWKKIKEAHEGGYLNELNGYYLFERSVRPIPCSYDWQDIKAHHARGGKFAMTVYACPECGKKVNAMEMPYTEDRAGRIRRGVCGDCYEKIMAKGYDDKYYSGLNAV